MPLPCVCAGSCRPWPGSPGWRSRSCPPWTARRNSSSWPATAMPATACWSAPMWASARTACATCTRPAIRASAMPSPIAPTAGRATPSPGPSPTTAPPPAWPASPSAPAARPNTATLWTAVSMPSPWPARNVGRACGWWTTRCSRPAAPCPRTAPRQTGPARRPCRRKRPCGMPWHGRPPCCGRATCWPSRAWAASSWPVTPAPPAAWPCCACASGARTSRWP